MKSQYQELISKPEFNFWVPIIFTAISITISFMTISNKVDLLTQKVEQLLANQETIIEKYTNVQVRLGTVEQKVVAIETRLSIK